MTDDCIPAEKAIKMMGRSMRKHVHNDFDVNALISGKEGIGKTTLGIMLGEECDPAFELDKNIIYRPEKVIKQIRALEKYQAALIDEAIRILYARTFYNKAQIAVNKYLRICRKENKILIWVIPHIMDLDSGVRNRRIEWWIWVLERDNKTGIGKAAMFVNDKNQVWDDSWGLNEAKKIFKAMRGRRFLMDVDERDRAIRKMPSFVTFLEFEKLADDKFAEYKRLAEEANKDISDVEELGDIENQYRNFMRSLVYNLKNKHNFKVDDLLEMGENNISKKTMYNLIKEEEKLLREDADS